MKKIKLYNKIFLLCTILAVVPMTSCLNDLDTEPIDENVLTSERAWRLDDTYDQFLAKNYAGLTLSGNKGPSDLGDLNNGDQGVATFTRGLWNLQVVTTDEAVNSWGDDGLDPLQFNQWSASNNYCYQFFQRAMLNVAFANEYLRETTDERLQSRGMTHLSEKVKVYRDEVRALRALNYYYLLDLYGNPPFVDENSPVGATVHPEQIKRADLFAWLESELKALEANNVLPATDYSRMSIATVRVLLTKLYLNAEVYTGTAKYSEAATYAKKVIDTYSNGLNGSYKNLFRADNDMLSNEIILGLPYDENYATTYGGTTFLIASAIAGDMSPASNFGLDASWSGNRAPKELSTAFDAAKDNRFLFWTADRVQDINDIKSFTQGFSVVKFSNLKSTETSYPNPTSAPRFANTDFPMFRLADVYLMYVEALLRKGDASSDIATYFNKIRARAGISTLSQSQITLDVVLSERMRELYWEGHRRTDLIRFGKYISGYNWTFKGGVRAGTDINPRNVLFPIPTLELGANPNLKQNPGY